MEPGPDWTVVAGADGAVPLGWPAPRCSWRSRRRASRLVLPSAPRLHVFVASGAVMLGERRLEPGDAARLVDEGGRVITAEVEGQVLVWAFAAAGRRTHVTRCY